MAGPQFELRVFDTEAFAKLVALLIQRFADDLPNTRCLVLDRDAVISVVGDEYFQGPGSSGITLVRLTLASGKIGLYVSSIWSLWAYDLLVQQVQSKFANCLTVVVKDGPGSPVFSPFQQEKDPFADVDE